MQSKGLKAIARNGFFDRIEGEVRRNGSALVSLRPGGRVSEEDVKHFAKTQGWVATSEQNGLRVGRVIGA